MTKGQKTMITTHHEVMMLPMVTLALRRSFRSCLPTLENDAPLCWTQTKAQVEHAEVGRLRMTIVLIEAGTCKRWTGIRVIVHTGRAKAMISTNKEVSELWLLGQHEMSEKGCLEGHAVGKRSGLKQSKLSQGEVAEMIDIDVGHPERGRWPSSTEALWNYNQRDWGYSAPNIKGVATLTASRIAVSLSDFKSNEYKGLVGSKQCDEAPHEESPTIGFCGRARTTLSPASKGAPPWSWRPQSCVVSWA